MGDVDGRIRVADGVDRRFRRNYHVPLSVLEMANAVKRAVTADVRSMREELHLESFVGQASNGKQASGDAGAVEYMLQSY